MPIDDLEVLNNKSSKISQKKVFQSYVEIEIIAHMIN